MTREFRLMLAEQGAADPELAGRDVRRPAGVSAAEAMREMAARAVEQDKIDNRVRLDKTKHKSLTAWMNAQRAAYIRALPIPTDPRDAEIARLRAALTAASDLAWTDTHTVKFDSTILFSKGYDFEGLEARRSELWASTGSYIVWPNQLGGAKKWSVYCDGDGGLWWEKFTTEAEAKACAVTDLSQKSPEHPASLARAALTQSWEAP